MDRLVALLDQLSEQIWKTDLDDDVSELLRARCSQLDAQTAVQHALQKTVNFVLNGTTSNAQSRISKFLDTLYGDTKQVNANLDAKWQCLRDLDCGTFLLIAASYTPLEVAKMSRVEFDYLVQNAASYAQSKSVPSTWIFCKEVQLAMVEKSDLPNIRPFKKRYHDLEYSDYVPTVKRRRLVPDQACVDQGKFLFDHSKSGHSNLRTRHTNKLRISVVVLLSQCRAPIAANKHRSTFVRNTRKNGRHYSE